MAKKIEAKRKNGKVGLRDGYVDITTRAEAELLPRLKQLSQRYGGTLTNMYGALLKQFLIEQPWNNHNIWRKTKGLTERTRDVITKKTLDGKPIAVPVTWSTATGWIQINLRVEYEVAESIKALAAAEGESPSTILYSALFWWVFVKNYNKP